MKRGKHEVRSILWLDDVCIGEPEIYCPVAKKTFRVDMWCEDEDDVIVCPYCSAKLRLRIVAKYLVEDVHKR